MQDMANTGGMYYIFARTARPGKTSAILYNANYADNGERKTGPACTHNPRHYVSWRGFAKTVVRLTPLPTYGLFSYCAFFISSINSIIDSSCLRLSLLFKRARSACSNADKSSSDLFFASFSL